VVVGWQRRHFSFGRFLLSIVGLTIGIAFIVVLAQMAWDVILKKYSAGAAADAGFESSATWLFILMAIATVLTILLLSLLDRSFGGVNLAVAAPIIFLIVAFIFYFLDASGNPFTIGWFAWSFLGCIAGLGILLVHQTTCLESGDAVVLRFPDANHSRSLLHAGNLHTRD
jgi:hypothetical protein